MNERAIFDAALEIQDPDQRRAFLHKTCGDSSELRACIEALLAAHDGVGSFLDVPAIEQVQTGTGSPIDRTTDFSPQIRGEEDGDDDDIRRIVLSFLRPSQKPGSIGTLGHYEILKILGQGGFGVVLKAFDEKLHRHVAIKMMNPRLAATSPPRKRFLREARAAAAIRHENIVLVYSVEEQPLPYLVMEYISGDTLQQKLDAKGPLSTTEVLHLGRQIAAGLAAAHASGLIHRDIKPGNILIEEGVEQKVKITDFGMARAADDASMTRSGVVSGTPMYMAPEQAQGQSLDHRSDLFSLGSVLYQMACGRPPFRAATAIAVLRRVVEDTPRPIQEILPEIPDWLVAIVAKLHAKKREERFQSAKEVADLLGLCQSKLQAGGTPTAVSLGLKLAPIEPIAKAEPKLKKFPVAAVAAGVVLMFTLMAVGLFFLNKNNDDGNVAVVPAATPTVPPKQIRTDSRVNELKPILAAKPLIAGLLKAGVGFHVSNPSRTQPLKLGSIDELADADRLQTLVINGAAVADPANIALLKRLPAEIWTKAFHERTIYLNGPFSPGQLRELLAIPAFQSISALFLDAGATPLAESSLADLVRFTELQHLMITGPSVTDNLLKTAIAAMPHLVTLGLDSSKVTNSGLAILRERPFVKLAFQSCTPIDDTTADHLAAIPTLVSLEINRTSVTDVGLAKLTTLTKLTQLNVDGTKVTEVGVKKLAAALPQCQIFWAGGVIEPKMLLPQTFKNSIGMEFVIVPKGTGWLGGGAGKQGETKVVIEQDFYLGKYEVTQEEWEAVTGQNPSEFKRGNDVVKDVPDADLKRLPVESVSWDDCQLFIKRLNEKEKDTGWVYRLPKEAEWEYACRGGAVEKSESAFDFYFAKPTNTLLPTQANFQHDRPLKRTCKVGSYKPNLLGLHDMHGNLWEWCEDAEKAIDGAILRVDRGGCFSYGSQDCRAGLRSMPPPSFRHHLIGLRLARVPFGPAVSVPATTDPNRRAAE